ncbi:MAG: sulfatase-like hydrolase/transferase [Rhodobacteraceae bacterium]|nr:sulfatase-like hydrolase/transferase [Paracoccaceae bacterium]
MGRQPNFVYIITDQHRADWLGCMGHPVVRTPNIDTLAARGTVFEEFHVASPVCMPNRASLLTGRMPGLHGLRYNGCALPAGANTFVDVLRAGGYATAAIGKSHVQTFSPVELPLPAPASGLPQPVAEAWKPAPDRYDSEQPGTYARTTPAVLPAPYYGYDHVEMVTRHGDRTGGHYEQWVKASVPDWQALWDDANQLPHGYTCPQAYRTPVPEDVYPTTWIADRAIDYLRGRKGHEQPFFAFVSFPDPHHPFNPPGRYWDMYSPEDFAVDLPYGAHQNPPPPLAHMKARFDAGQPPENPYVSFYADDRSIREAMALTAGMVTMIDDQIGRILAALREAGLDQDTVVVFNADHGDHMGDFNTLLKGPMPTRSIARVPFIWADPVRPGGRRTRALASTIDAGATILERAGLEPYNGMQGRGLGRVLSGATDEHRPELYLEYNTPRPQLGMSAPARVRSLVTREWRYTLYGGEEWGELYDLAADPRETRNLWDDPAHATTRAQLAERLARQMAQQMDTSPRASRVA